MEVLIIAQTIFYFVISLAIIVLGILFALGAYYLIRIAKELSEISKNLHNASDEALEGIKDIIEKLSNLPILSFFLKNEPKKKKK